MLHLTLDFGIVKFMVDDTLGIKNGILRVGMGRVLCAFTDTDIDRPIRVVSKIKKVYLSAVVHGIHMLGMGLAPPSPI